MSTQMKDFLGNDIQIGDYFLQANHAGRSGVADLLIGRVVGKKKTRLYYIRYWPKDHKVQAGSYTTRYEAMVIVPPIVLPGEAVYTMDSLFPAEKAKYADFQ